MVYVKGLLPRFTARSLVLTNTQSKAADLLTGVRKILAAELPATFTCPGLAAAREASQLQIIRPVTCIRRVKVPCFIGTLARRGVRPSIHTTQTSLARHSLIGQQHAPYGTPTRHVVIGQNNQPLTLYDQSPGHRQPI